MLNLVVGQKTNNGEKNFFTNRTVFDELLKLINTVRERINIGVGNLTDLF